MQNQSYELGLKLKLKRHVVDAIHSRYHDPKERLLQILLKFVKQVEPKPTWSVIIDALRSQAVDHPKLANKLEAAHIPDSVPTPDFVRLHVSETGLHSNGMVY